MSPKLERSPLLGSRKGPKITEPLLEPLYRRAATFPECPGCGRTDFNRVPAAWPKTRRNGEPQIPISARVAETRPAIMPVQAAECAALISIILTG